MLFILCAYGFFWLYLMIGISAIMIGILPGDGVPMKILTTIGSWTPTVALLVLFKRLFPAGSAKSFYRSAFKERINIGLVLLTTVIQILIFLSAAGMISVANNSSFSGLFDLSPRTVGTGVFWTLIQGATGEESGWRGYLQPSVEKRHGVIKASIIVGLIWTFWHIPLWFTAGFAGKDLMLYILAFLITITSLAVLIGICYKCCRNLFIPIWVHFVFNFVLTVFTGDQLILIAWLAVFHAVAALGYGIWYYYKEKSHANSNQMC